MNQKQLNLNNLKKEFAIKRSLFNRGLFAALVLTILFLVMAILLFVANLWFLAIPLLVLFISQLIIESYMYYQLNYGFANIKTITKYKKVWIFFLFTFNITGAIYIGLLVKKKVIWKN